jgi:RNA polymerase sigma factor (sigma-70 family)
MERRDQGIVARQLDVLFNSGPLGGLTDAQLLERFASRQDQVAEMAFAALIQRHGPGVLRICRAMLRDPDDVHDAFQATFLVLARKSGSLWVRDSLGPWLHRVARRTASRARATAARRGRTEPLTPAMATGPSAEDDRIELRLVILEELSRLPQRYREAVVCCLVDGERPDQAARLLGWPIGTVHSRLARGRRLLQSRLARRGFLPGAAGLTMALAAEVRASLPRDFVDLTARGAPGFLSGRGAAEGISASAVILSERILRTMHFQQLKWAGVLAATVGLSFTGLAMLSKGAPAPLPSSPQVKSRHGLEPTASPSDGVATEKVTAVRDMDRAKVWVLDPRTRSWRTYRAREGTKVAPSLPGYVARAGEGGGSMEGSYVALEVEGQDITEIAAYWPKSGAWVRQVLRKPVTGNIGPSMIEEQFALYSVGGHAYAFSALTGTWDSVDLQVVDGPRVERLAVPGMALVKGSGPLYVYDARTGRFKDVESEED